MPALHSTAATTASEEGLDLATVMKASHTISGEILIDKLVETLMVTAVQHAGAEHGVVTKGLGLVPGTVTRLGAPVVPHMGWNVVRWPAGARLAEGLAPDARFVKAFSCVGNAFMVNPKFPGGPPTMFICGNDKGANAEARGILEQFGWDVADMGGAEGARAIEPLCILWCIPGLTGNSWTHAFKLLRM